MSDTTSIRVFSVDDHALLREGIAADHHQRARHGRWWRRRRLAARRFSSFAQHRPDVTLMDLRLPDMSGIDAMIAIRTESPDARIVVLTTFEGDVEMQRALRPGRAGTC